MRALTVSLFHCFLKLALFVVKFHLANCFRTFPLLAKGFTVSLFSSSSVLLSFSFSQFARLFFVGSVGHYLKEHKNNQGCGPTRIAKKLSATGVDEHCWLLVVVAAPSLPIICTLPPETSTPARSFL